MSAHALLIVLNEFGKRYVRLVERLPLFHNQIH